MAFRIQFHRKQMSLSSVVFHNVGEHQRRVTEVCSQLQKAGWLAKTRKHREQRQGEGIGDPQYFFVEGGSIKNSECIVRDKIAKRRNTIVQICEAKMFEFSWVH